MLVERFATERLRPLKLAPINQWTDCGGEREEHQGVAMAMRAEAVSVTGECGHCWTCHRWRDQDQLTTEFIAALKRALQSTHLLPGELARRSARSGVREYASGALAPTGVPSELHWATGCITEIDGALAQARVAFARLGAALAHAHADELAGILALVPTVAGDSDALSPREAEVLGLLARGASNRDIAQALFLSPRTVQRHVANVYLKIGAHNRAEATAYALTHRLA